MSIEKYYELAEEILVKDEENDFINKIKKDLKIDEKFNCFLKEKLLEIFKSNNILLADPILLKMIISESDNDLFDSILESFEYLVNSSKILLDTNTVRAFFLCMFSKKEELNKDKIKKICKNKILNSNNNLCDKELEEIPHYLFIDTKDFYSNYIPVVFNIISMFTEEEILKSVLPTIKNKIVAEKYSHLHLGNLIKHENQAKIIEEKLGSGFLQELYVYSSDNIEKENILKYFLKVYGNNINTKKKIIMMNLLKLDMENFEKAIKKYPNALKSINKQDVEKFKTGNVIVFHDKKNILKKYNLNMISIFEPNSLRNINENILRIINYEQIELEKKEINDNMILTKNSSENKKRI